VDALKKKNEKCGQCGTVFTPDSQYYEYETIDKWKHHYRYFCKKCCDQRRSKMLFGFLAAFLVLAGALFASLSINIGNAPYIKTGIIAVLALAALALLIVIVSHLMLLMKNAGYSKR
jgi:hypothetical protein